MQTIFAVPRSYDDTNVENFFSFDEFNDAVFYCIENDVTHFFEAHSLYSEEPVSCFFLYEKDDGIVVMRVDDEDCDLYQYGGFTLH
ncbi:MAG: hypothetical protein EKE20_17570 [Candidatus Symbiopectobacterium sp. Dall1.0]|nr:hypothetical protein [Candidatus Symbiopectobacterium sp. Dall1.0]